jgi:hypothetical protein
MLWIFSVVLLALWLLGVLNHVGGGAIHLLLVGALGIFISIILNRREMN